MDAPRVRIRAVADRVLPRRHRPDRAVQLALRAPQRRHVPPAHRGHRRGAQPRGVGRRDPRGAGVARTRRPTSRPCARASSPTAHRAAADRLLAAGALYGCDCTREAIDARLKGTGRTGYDGHCRDRGSRRGPGVALRFRAPDEGETLVHDVIRGDVEFPNAAHRGLRRRASPTAACSSRSRTSSTTATMRDHPRHPRRGAPRQHAQAAPARRGARRVEGRRSPPPVFAHLPAARQRAAQEALQAPRPRRRRVLPRPGLPRRRRW